MLPFEVLKEDSVFGVAYDDEDMATLVVALSQPLFLGWRESGCEAFGERLVELVFDPDISIGAGVPGVWYSGVEAIADLPSVNVLWKQLVDFSRKSRFAHGQ